MSHTETHFGKLRKVQIDIPLEEWFKQKCLEKGITELAAFHRSWQEEFTYEDDFTEKFFIVDGEVWEAFDHIEESDGDIDVMLPNEDGTITFVQQFYNGGTCLNEVIGIGIKRLKKQKHNYVHDI